MIKRLFSYRTPQNLILLINFMALLLLTIYQKNFDRNIIIAGVIFILTIYVANYVMLKVSSGDHYIFLIVTMLISIGIIMIYRISPESGIKQVLWFAVGIITFFASYLIVKYIKNWEKYTLLYIILSIVLFLATLILGVRVKGAINWIKVGGYTFQPSELIKVLFVFFLGSYYMNIEKFKSRFKDKYKYIFLGVVYTYIGFLFIQRDLGSALLFYLVFITLFYIYEEDRRLILYNLMGAALIGIISYFLLNHVRVRIETWINPWIYIDNKGYQITQSLFAIASGGFFGTGLGLGHPEFIPEVHTDFIFSAICEEMGIFTGIAVVFLFFILIYRGFKIALQQHHKFYRIVSLGITLMLGYQSIIILGGVIKLIPLTGVTLPFVSYGGSSLVSSFAALGILQVTSEELDIEQEEDYGQRIQEDN